MRPSLLKCMCSWLALKWHVAGTYVVLSALHICTTQTHIQYLLFIRTHTHINRLNVLVPVWRAFLVPQTVYFVVAGQHLKATPQSASYKTVSSDLRVFCSWQWKVPDTLLSFVVRAYSRRTQCLSMFMYFLLIHIQNEKKKKKCFGCIGVTIPFTDVFLIA